MFKSLMILSLFLTACDPSFSEIPGQRMAEAIVWHEMYGEYDSAPSVHWVFQQDLNCSNETGYLSYGVCVGGNYMSPPLDFIECAWPDYITLISETSYAHENLHAHLQRLTGNADPSHSGPEWQPGGLLQRANNELRNRGY